MKGKVLSLFLIVAMCLMFNVASFASGTTSAWGDFSVHLPEHQGDIETPSIARVNNTTTKKYFSLDHISIGSGYTAVRVWTEKAGGINLSSPTRSVGQGSCTCSYYTNSVPSAGTNVRLNLDNPVDTYVEPRVAGSWTPN